MKISVFWFRRDLRLDDNIGLFNALNSHTPVLPVFIFDTNIIDELPADDARISFIFKNLKLLNNDLKKKGSSLCILKGKPLDIWKKLISEYEISAVYFNKDYEPYAIKRDNEVTNLLNKNGIKVFSFKDQVIFEEDEVMKEDLKPYTVFTPYKNKWLKKFYASDIKISDSILSDNFLKSDFLFPSLKELGFIQSGINVSDYDLSVIPEYHKTRDFPYIACTSRLSPHLRFGTVSIRKIIKEAAGKNQIFLSELIWREFFMQILYHFPKTAVSNFRNAYNNIKWRNNEKEFRKWCNGETGYPIVDAGMRQLKETGSMHNRVRMITAAFLCKHLLIDWRLGEAYFAEKLIDFDLSANVGNWQWAAGTGCDAAPYFRIFNPEVQLMKYDRDLKYVRKWIHEFGKSSYPEPMIEHNSARLRAIEAYRKSLTGY